VTVAYTTGPTGEGDGHADGEADYASTQGTLTFQVGETQKYVSVAVAGDLEVELDETFRVTLSNVAGATLVVDSVVATIANDDVAPGG
jgi:chitinase